MGVSKGRGTRDIVDDMESLGEHKFFDLLANSVWGFGAPEG